MITWAELTADEQEALKEYSSGKKCYEMGSKIIGSLSYKKFMVCVYDELSTGWYYIITDLGREVLAQAEAAKPETISAAEFVAGDYAAKIKIGECVICDTVDGSEVINLEQEWRGSYAYTWTDKLGAQWGCHHDEEFTVTWFAQADTANAGEGAFCHKHHTEMIEQGDDTCSAWYCPDCEHEKEMKHEAQSEPDEFEDVDD